MQESGKSLWALKKAYEIAYATFRIAAKMAEREFAAHLKNAAISLIGSVAQYDYPAAAKRLVSLEYLIRFAMDVSVMGIVNGEIMLQEIQGLGEALTEFVGAAEMSGADNINEEADIAGIFSEGGFEDEKVNPANSMNEAKTEIRQIRQSGKNEESGNRPESGNGEISGILKSAIRQSAILERIRQIGNCRIKDIQEILPDSSERTIRYDLGTMVEQNLIERVGSGGPSVFYRIRDDKGISG